MGKEKCRPRESSIDPPSLCPPEKTYRWYILATVEKFKAKYSKQVEEMRSLCTQIDSTIAEIKEYNECEDKFFNEGEIAATMTVEFTTKMQAPDLIVLDYPKTFDDLPTMVKLLMVLGVSIPLSIFMIGFSFLCRKLGKLLGVSIPLSIFLIDLNFM